MTTTVAAATTCSRTLKSLIADTEASEHEVSKHEASKHEVDKHEVSLEQFSASAVEAVFRADTEYYRWLEIHNAADATDVLPNLSEATQTTALDAAAQAPQKSCEFLATFEALEVAGFLNAPHAVLHLVYKLLTLSHA